MNTTQVCVAGIVAVVVLGVVGDIKARFNKRAPNVAPARRMSKEERHEVVMGHIRKTHRPELHDAFDIIGRVNMDSLYR